MIPAARGGIGSTGFDKAMTPGLEKDTWIAPEEASGSAAEAPFSVPEGISSTSPETVSDTQPGASTSTKPEVISASVQEATPHATPGIISSTDPEKALESDPEVATSSVPEAAYSTDPEKVPASTVPLPNGKGSPPSSNLEKEVDLEAGHRSEDSDKIEPETTKTEADPNIVDWDGPDDPNNPINWSEKLKWANVAVISSITFLTQVTPPVSSIEYNRLI